MSENIQDKNTQANNTSSDNNTENSKVVCTIFK